ncbi:MAG: hypothetical protein WD800_06980, partial [Dehalococcoidia bacterium]
AVAAREFEAYRELADLIALSVPLRHADPALRERVIEAARRAPSQWRTRRNWRRFVPAAALAAGLVLVGGWAVSLQATIGELRADQAALAAVVEADAKRLDSIDQTALSAQRTETLGIQLETSLRDQQVFLAVQSDPDARRTRLDPTGAAHGAHGTYLWSDANGAGALLVYDLPALGLGETYKLWLEDASSRQVFASTFVPDARGDATVAVAFEAGREPVRLYLVAASAGGTDGPVVLQGVLSRDAKAPSTLLR